MDFGFNQISDNASYQEKSFIFIPKYLSLSYIFACKIGIGTKIKGDNAWMTSQSQAKKKSLQ